MTDRDPDWDDPARVDRWVTRDAARPALRTARELTVAMIALDTRPATVLELAGGAGTSLATFLDAFPDARGVWSDSSREMQRHAAHLDALRDVGLTEADTPWRLLSTVLLLARRPLPARAET